MSSDLERQAADLLRLAITPLVPFFPLQPDCVSRSKYVRVSDNWLAQGLTHLRCNGPWSNEPSKLADHLFGLFLSSDLYLCKGAEPAFPDGLDGMHRVVICQAPVCLQVDEAVNVSQQMPSDPAANAAPPSQIIMDTPDKDNRNLPGKLNKLFLTDGHRQAVGLDLDGLLAHAQGQGHAYAPGCKVLVWGVTVRRGVLMLRRDSMRVLGGRVNRLAAYQTQPLTQPQGQTQTQTQQQPAAAQPAQQAVTVPVPQQQLPPPPLPRVSMPMPSPAPIPSSSSSSSSSTSSSYYQQQQLHPHPQHHLSASSASMPMAAPARAPPRPAPFAPPQPPAYHFQYEEEEEEDEQDEQQIWEEDEGFMEPAPTARTSTAAAAVVTSAAVTAVPPNSMIGMMRDQQVHDRPHSSNGSKGGDMVIIDEEEVVEVEDDERAEEEVEEVEEELYVQDLCSTSSGVQQEQKEEAPTSTSCPGLSRLVDVTITPEEVHTVRGFACKLYRYREVEGEVEEVVLGLDDGHCPRPVTVAPSLANGFLASCTSEGVRAAGEAGRRARMLAFQQFSGIFLARSISSTSSGVGVSQGSSTASSASSGTPEVVLVDALALHGMEACDGPALLAVCRDMLAIYGTELLQ